MKVLVTGGLVFHDRDWLFAGLDLLHSKQPITQIVEGGRPGVDVRAQEWAYKREIQCLTIPARFSQLHGEAEPTQRLELARSAPAIVLACPGADTDTIAVLKAHELTVIRLEKMPVARTTKNRPLAQRDDAAVLSELPDSPNP